MEKSDEVMMYCTTHGEMVPVPADAAEPFHIYEETIYDALGFYTEEKACFGEFTECPPPPVTEEEWSFIFGLEDSCNAVESII